MAQRAGFPGAAAAGDGERTGGERGHQSRPVASACTGSAVGDAVHRLDDAPHDGRRGLRAHAALFDDRDDDVAGRVRREEPGEHRRVALALFLRADLRGAGLAGHGDRAEVEALERGVRGSLRIRGDAGEAGEHLGAHVRVHRDLADRLRRVRLHDVAVRVLHVELHMRLPQRATVRERGVGIRELQRRHGHPALTDGGEDVVGGIPRAVLLLLRGGGPDLVGERLLPLGVGHRAGGFVELDARRRAESELVRSRLQAEATLLVAVVPRLPERVAGRVEVDVARAGDRALQLDAARARRCPRCGRPACPSRA